MKTSTTAEKTKSDAEILALIKPYSGHQTSDGRIFDDTTQAFDHEKELIRQQKLSVFCHEHVCYNMGAGDIAEILEKNREELLLILA